MMLSVGTGNFLWRLGSLSRSMSEPLLGRRGGSWFRSMSISPSTSVHPTLLNGCRRWGLILRPRVDIIVGV